MADLPNPPVLETDGTYDVLVDAGRNYLLNLKGEWNGAAVQLDYLDKGFNTWTPVNDGTFTTNTEVRMVPPSGALRFTLSGASPGLTYISLTLIPITP